METKKISLKEFVNLVKRIIKEESENEFDIISAIECSENDGYSNIKNKLGAEEDLDFKELNDKDITIWNTKKLGDITFSLNKGNVWTVKVRTDNDYFGENSTYDYDECGLAMTTMSALKDMLNDVDETFTNESETPTNKRFAITLDSDQGKIRIKTSASDEDVAKQMVLSHQNAPESAIIKIEEI